MHRPPPRHARRLPSHRVARMVGLAATGALAFVATGTVAALVDWKSDIEVTDVDALLGRDGGREDRREPARGAQNPEDPFAGEALNILVMGTDFRDAENAAIAGEGDEFHSDTTVLVHVSGDRSRMEVVSIPRDSLVDIPACPRPDGSQTEPDRLAMFNTAFRIGGGDEQDLTAAAACTILTFETLTGLSVTDHVVVKMTGVIGVVDAVGGVRMCLPEPVKESKRYGSLNLPAGEQRLDGHTAIQFLRVRHGTGMGLELGSDLTRIQRQQAFLDAALREVLSQNVITDAPRLYRMVQAVLRSISTSPDLASPTALAGLAWSLREIDPAQIVFTSVPVEPWPRNPDRVVWTADAAAIWARIAADQPPPGSPTPSPTPSPAESPAGSGEPTTAATTEPASPAPSPAPAQPAPEPTLPGVCA